MKCKHENGWFIPEKPTLRVNKCGQVIQSRIEHGKNGHLYFHEGITMKHVATCNNSNCSATRNVYIETKLIKMGRVKK